MEVQPKGWDTRESSSGQTQRYFFTIPTGKWAGTFSAALTWHRVVPITFGTPTLVDLNLRLYAAGGLAVQGSAIDQSISAVDNVEHLFLRNLPAGQYALEVSTGSPTAYALAWEAQLSGGPAASVRRTGSGQIWLDLSGLDPYVTYTVESSSTLAALDWQTATTLRTADTTAATTASWQDTSAGSAVRKFYRLRWTTLR